MADSLEQAAAELQQTFESIDTHLEKIVADNRRMRSLLSQAALFVACQPENKFRARWLKECEELCSG